MTVSNCTKSNMFIIILTCVISVVLTVFVMIHVFKYERVIENGNMNIDKTDGGYITTSFISDKSLPKDIDDPKSIDKSMKSSVYECFKDEKNVKINVEPSIMYEKNIIKHDKEESLNEFTRKLLTFSEEFEPDSSVIFNDSPNTVFIFEFDEGGNFHTDSKNPNYVKKTLTYNNMILHNNPAHNTSFIIVRITYPTDIDKNDLVDKVFPILEYIKKYHLLFISALLGSGYVLIKLTKRIIYNMILIDKERMNKLDNDNDESKCTNLNKLYDDETKTSQYNFVQLSYEDIVRIDPKPLRSIDTVKGGCIFGSRYIEEIPTVLLNSTLDRFRKDSIKLFDKLEDSFNYCPRIYVNEVRYNLKYQFNDIPIWYAVFDITNEKNFTLSDYNYYKYPDHESPLYMQHRGKRFLFKKFINGEFKNIISNPKELYHERICYFNTLVGVYIQAYENWFAMHSYGDGYDEYYPAVCHATDDFYDDLHVYELVESLRKFIIPEFIDRIQHPSRIMNTEESLTKGINDKLTLNENVEWIIPDVKEFNEEILKFTLKYYNGEELGYDDVDQIWRVSHEYHDGKWMKRK